VAEAFEYVERLFEPGNIGSLIDLDLNLLSADRISRTMVAMPSNQSSVP
jgi:hypothetical protein